ncbi:hypothetical protein [Streptomyces sp. XY533]|uniref:hypothetical protein n=1 Tax=Streptomyces sp. XY533 TaxID=1519481 RepID=UPI0006AE6FE8|nr:hypothetical protein [Streptomyces sp. XY533]KOV07522.1 hypothetical protein ADK92_05775 [Streptomyces sp. XY533]
MATRTATKPADDQPFDFNLDAVESEVELRPFRIHFNGRRWTFEHLEGLDIWDLVEAAEGGQVKAMIGIFEISLGEQWPEFRQIKLPQYKMKALFTAYQKHCGLKPGESEASGN